MTSLLPPFAFAKALWKTLTTGTALFEQLQREADEFKFGADWLHAVERQPPSGDRRPTLPYIANWWWESHAGRSSADDARRWQVFAQILWSFDMAHGPIASAAPSAVDRARLGLKMPVFDSGTATRYTGDPTASDRANEVARAYMCIRSFLNIEATRVVEVPIALYDGDASFVAMLTLELMEGGVGEVAPHLALAFDTIHHSTFEQSIKRAWKLAHDGSPTTADGRWRIRRRTPLSSGPGIAVDLAGIGAVDGPSAGGAAARGWWYLLRQMVPDAEVVVMAQIADDGSLKTVDHIADKARAVVNERNAAQGASAFDTIVVIGQAAERLARSLLAESEIRVIALDRAHDATGPSFQNNRP